MVLKEVENWQIIHSTVMLLLTIQDMTGKKPLIHTVKAPSSHLEQGQLIQFQEIQIPFFIYIFTLKCRPLIYNSEPQKGLNGNICPVCCSVLCGCSQSASGASCSVFRAASRPLLSPLLKVVI